MADEATQDTASEAVEQTVTDESTAGNEQEQGAEQASQEIDWKAKFEAQQKISRDLEKKVKGEAGTLKSQLEELQAKLDGKEKEYAAEQERRKVEAEALAKADERILKAEIRAAAAQKLADPADALRFIDLDEFEVGTEGDVDSEAISVAIDGLLKEKPYLAAQGGSGPVFESPGSHRDPKKVQVTRSEVERMSPEQVRAARAEGRLNDLLGIKD